MSDDQNNPKAMHELKTPDPTKASFAPCPGSEALAAVIAERNRQDAKWGIQNHAPHIWLVILGEEFGEASKATLEMDWNAYRTEMVQVAAVAVAAIEACDRELGVPPNADISDRR